MSSCPGEGKRRQVTALVGEEGEGMRSRIVCRRGSKMNILDEFCIWNAAL